MAPLEHGSPGETRGAAPPLPTKKVTISFHPESDGAVAVGQRLRMSLFERGITSSTNTCAHIGGRWWRQCVRTNLRGSAIYLPIIDSAWLQHELNVLELFYALRRFSRFGSPLILPVLCPDLIASISEFAPPQTNAGSGEAGPDGEGAKAVARGPGLPPHMEVGMNIVEYLPHLPLRPPLSSVVDAIMRLMGEAIEGFEENLPEGGLSRAEEFRKFVEQNGMQKPNSGMMRRMRELDRDEDTWRRRVQVECEDPAPSPPKSLSDLDMHADYIGDFGARALAHLLPMQPLVTSLGLPQNGITNIGCRALIHSLRDHPGVTDVDLSKNDLTSAVGPDLYGLVSTNQQITKLNLESTSINFCFKARIRKCLERNAKLNFATTNIDMVSDSLRYSDELLDEMKAEAKRTALLLPSSPGFGGWGVQWKVNVFVCLQPNSPADALGSSLKLMQYLNVGMQVVANMHTGRGGEAGRSTFREEWTYTDTGNEQSDLFGAVVLYMRRFEENCTAVRRRVPGTAKYVLESHREGMEYIQGLAIDEFWKRIAGGGEGEEALSLKTQLGSERPERPQQCEVAFRFTATCHSQPKGAPEALLKLIDVPVPKGGSPWSTEVGMCTSFMVMGTVTTVGDRRVAKSLMQLHKEDVMRYRGSLVEEVSHLLRRLGTDSDSDDSEYDDYDEEGEEGEELPREASSPLGPPIVHPQSPEGGVGIHRLTKELQSQLRPTLGIDVAMLDDPSEGKKDVQVLVVGTVIGASAANQAGIREGDILLSWAGDPLDTKDKLDDRVKNSVIGSTVEVGLKRRDGEGEWKALTKKVIMLGTEQKKSPPRSSSPSQGQRAD